MKKSLLDKIKQSLLKEKNDICAKQLEIIDIDTSGDEVDLIQSRILANVQEQLSSRDKVKLKYIDIALTKIEEDNFGICEECGEKIAEKRLLINPIFNNCISCAEQLEMQEKRNKRM